MAGPDGVYICPHPTCDFTTVKESVLNGHVVVAHQVGQDLTHSSGSEVEFSGYGEGACLNMSRNILILGSLITQIL